MTHFKSTVLIGFKLFALSLIFLTSCKENKPPEGILEQEKMVQLLSDLHIMDGYSATVLYADSLRKVNKNYYAMIYAKHHVSEGIFQKSFNYYSKKPELLDSIYTQVENIILEKEMKLNKINEAKRNKLFRKK